MLKHFLLFIGLLLAALPGRSQSFDFQKEFPYRSLFSWKPGMRFLLPAATNGSVECPLMVLKGPTFKGTDLYGTSPDDKALAGMTFTFQRVEAFQDRGYDNKSGSGTEQVAVVFKASNGKQYAHVIRNTLAELKQQDEPVAGAPCLVALDDVEKARKLLVGQTLFVLEQYRSTSAARNDGQYLPKFVPVKITKVSPGRALRPVRLTFEYVGTNPRQVQEQDYLFSGTNGSLTYLTGKAVPEQFLKCFSFQDPRPTAGTAAAKDAHWKAIKQGVLIKGMSMREVEAAMGKPNRTAESMEEERSTIWYYNRFQGKEWSLLFINGVLDRYANYQN